MDGGGGGAKFSFRFIGRAKKKTIRPKFLEIGRLSIYIYNARLRPTDEGLVRTVAYVYRVPKCIKHVPPSHTWRSSLSRKYYIRSSSVRARARARGVKTDDAARETRPEVFISNTLVYILR